MLQEPSRYFYSAMAEGSAGFGTNNNKGRDIVINCNVGRGSLWC